jgi:diguanylate cyclase (GGDEF)-like protein
MVVSASMVYAADPRLRTIDLTPEEKAYLAEKKEITMCVDPDWEPFEIIDEEGRHVGIAADLIALVGERLKTPIRLIRTATWQETLERSKSGQCDILSFVNQTPEREKWLVFTQPLLVDPNILITREEHPFVANLNGLDGESVVLPSGTAMLERFSKDFPNLKMIPVVSEADAMAMVSEKKADMTVRSLIVAAYVIKKEGWFNLKISGQPAGYENRLRIGVLKDRPILRDILDKGIATITPIERETIINKHTGLVVNEGIDHETILKYLTFLVLIALIFMWRFFELKRYSKKLREISITDKLTTLYNRLKIDEELKEEYNRVNRYENYQCSVMMIDIDYFKAINDTFGHQKGDEILKKLSSTMKMNFRNTDSIGRWGGEEFIIMLPNTSVEEAYISAEKLRTSVQENVFTEKGAVTVSIGVGSFLLNESVDELLSRIDAALYDAKNKGRNRVCLV